MENMLYWDSTGPGVCTSGFKGLCNLADLTNDVCVDCLQEMGRELQCVVSQSDTLYPVYFMHSQHVDSFINLWPNNCFLAGIKQVLIMDGL